MLSFCQLITSDTAKQTVAFCYPRYLRRFIIFQLISLPSLTTHGPPHLMARLVSYNSSGELKTRARLGFKPKAELLGGLCVGDEDIHHFRGWTRLLPRPAPRCSLRGVDNLSVDRWWEKGVTAGTVALPRCAAGPYGHSGLEKLGLCLRHSWLLPHLSNRVAERLYKFMLSYGDYLCQLFLCQKQFF